jgi:hypothetical protein
MSAQACPRVLSGHHDAYTVEQKNTDDADFRDKWDSFIYSFFSTI